VVKTRFPKAINITIQRGRTLRIRKIKKITRKWMQGQQDKEDHIPRLNSLKDFM
jgi:hypothetical protein